MPLITLIDILKRQAETRVFPCIRELITEGLHAERLSPEDLVPSRQDITQFLAAWFRYVDVPDEICLEWLIPFCTERLSAMSSSSISQIRHSTKSNVKYIYESHLPFECGAKNNIFKASCTETCPLFDEMTQNDQVKLSEKTTWDDKPKLLDQRAIEGDTVAVGSLKEQYQEQFHEAMEFACDQVAKGVTKKHIVKVLNEKGFKTRTGRAWSQGILSSELKRVRI